MASMGWATVATIIYFSLNMLLVLCLSIFVHLTEDHENKKEFVKSVWAQRGIYGQLLVHLYDTATDIGVLVQWGILAYDEHDYDSIDMLGLFWTSIGFLIFYRLFSGCIATCAVSDEYEELKDNVIQNILLGCRACCLGLFDMFIIRIVIRSALGNATEPTDQQKMVQLFEAILESLPQVVLQSVFIIRSFNDERIKNNGNLILVGVSLAASLFSIANKYTWLDKNGVREAAQDVNFKTKIPFVNWWYVLRIVWRFNYVATRFSVLSLVWSVLGGTVIFIYLACSWIYWIIAYLIWIYSGLVDANELNCDDWCGICFPGIVYGFVSLISTPASATWTMFNMHMIEMILAMSIITWFAYDPLITCGVCADPYDRQATHNPYIKMFIITGWSTMAVDFITYIVLLLFDNFTTDAFMESALMLISGFEFNIKDPDQ
eukprot:301909_1